MTKEEAIIDARAAFIATLKDFDWEAAPSLIAAFMEGMRVYRSLVDE